MSCLVYFTSNSFKTATSSDRSTENIISMEMDMFLNNQAIFFASLWTSPTLFLLTFPDFAGFPAKCKWLPAVSGIKTQP